MKTMFAIIGILYIIAVLLGKAPGLIQIYFK